MALGLEGLFEVPSQRVKLERRLDGRDHEVIRERRRLRDVDQREVERQVLRKDVDGAISKQF